MSAIAKLKLISSKRQQVANPIVQRRLKLASKIAEQIELSTAQREGRTYAPKRLKTVTDQQTGQRSTVESVKRVKEWFWIADNGKINLSVQYGSKTLELAKGKNAIEVGSGDELLATLDLLKDAVLAGELDEAVNNASVKLREAFVK
jgi:hypothetical protein